jgi:threonine/homoserine/homoserine lactone efflux protein
MTTSGEYAVFAVSFAASAVAPGPDIAAVVARALSRGLRGCAPLALGIIAGKVALLTVAMVGTAALVTALGPWVTVGLYFAAAYLCYLGVRKWCDASAPVVEVDAPEREGVTRDARPPDGGLRARRWPGPRQGDRTELHGGMYGALGFGMAVSNPIAIAFYMALLPGVIDMTRATVGTYLVLVSIVAIIMSATVAAYGLAAALARKLLDGGPAKVWTDRVAGVVFIAAGVWVAGQPLL